MHAVTERGKEAWYTLSVSFADSSPKGRAKAPAGAGSHPHKSQFAARFSGERAKRLSRANPYSAQPPLPGGRGVQTVKKASQSSLRQQRKESEPFSARACTWQKIHLRLQVWNLFAYGEQIMRAADCKNWRKSPKGFFDKLDPPAGRQGGVHCILRKWARRRRSKYC